MPIRLVSTQVKIGAGRFMAAFALVLCASLCWPQQPAQPPAAQIPQPPAQAQGPTMLTVPAGTRILLALVRPVSTKSTKPGDPIYLQTTFPVTAGDKLLIPAGTFLEGTFASFKRHKDRVELQMQSAALIFNNGYKVSLAPAPDLAPGQDADIRRQPGHPTAAAASATGASAGGLAIGGIAAGTEGAVIGGAIGGPVGFVLAVILLNHGSSVQIEAGSPVEIILDHPLLLDERQVAEAVHQPSGVMAVASPPKTRAPKTCYSPGSPGTPDTVIPGSPGTPPTVIPGINGGPPTVIPGTPASPPTVIPGTPGTPGSSYPCP
ncbi:MAG TPA: hypothetical protein VF532_13350 [Candidatus Angelobacter sp.]